MTSKSDVGLFVVLLILVQLGALGSANRHHRQVHHLGDSSNKIPDNLETEHRILLECQNADYRTYIKCLKREKRQQNRDASNMPSCLEECFKKDCANSTCLRDCHSRCKSRRLVETYSKTVETDLDCGDGRCRGDNNNNGAGPNVTVHIENILPNHTYNTNNPWNLDGTNNSSNFIVPKVDINNVINNQFGFGPYGPQQPNCLCPGCDCSINYQPLPQITIGFGGGAAGGCMFQPWPCLQRNPYTFDCSMCNNPFLRIQCDVKCYNASGGSNDTQSTTTTTQRPVTPAQRDNNRYNYPNNISNNIPNSNPGGNSNNYVYSNRRQ